MERIVLCEWVIHRETTKQYRPGMTGTLSSLRKDACGRDCAMVTLDDGSKHILFEHEFHIIPSTEEPCSKSFRP